MFAVLWLAGYNLVVCMFLLLKNVHVSMVLLVFGEEKTNICSNSVCIRTQNVTCFAVLHLCHGNVI